MKNVKIGKTAPFMGRAKEGLSFLKKKEPWEFSGSGLKLFGACLMLLDHIGVAVIERGILKSGNRLLMKQILETRAGMGWWYVNRLLRCLGRMAFPIFAFFLVEGFCCSKRKTAYGLRLFGFALLTEIIFDLAIFEQWFYPQYQNVMFTLLIGYLTLWGIQKSRQKIWLRTLMAAAGCLAAFLLKTDYGAMGIMMIILLYWFRGTGMQLTVGAFAAAAESASSWGLSALAFVFLARYKGKRGNWPGKYFFYLFYPGHLFLLYLVRLFINDNYG
ncbi:MAG: hypothetical protein HFG49_10995 [Lachnospiraceae bacterium]|nr:hypothetical protein [Lachnospiraceae bacterium]